MMALTLNSQDLEDLKPYVDKAVQRYLGLSEPSVVSAAISLLGSGVDKPQFTSKIRSLHPSLSERAHKLTDTIFEIASEYVLSLQQHQQKVAKKRTSNDAAEAKAAKVAKSSGEEEEEDPTTPSPGQLTTLQIQQMMADAKRMISVRKQALEAKGITLPSSTPRSMPMQVPISGIDAPIPGVLVPPPMLRIPTQDYPAATPFDGADKKRKIAELQAQIASKLAAGGFKPDQEDEPSKPMPLLLDSEGRPIDVSGKQLLFPTRQPTLKANIRAQKRTEKPTKDRATVDDEEGLPPGGNKYFDERVTPIAALNKGVDRKKKALKFNDPGKYVALATKQRMQAKLANLKSEIEEKARKTGISTAARLAKLSGTSGQVDKTDQYIPQVEWWDQIILEEDKRNQELITYDSPLKLDSITNLIEHPTQMRPPTEPNEPEYMPVFLTKQEKKKLRRQNRRETLREKQEKIRLGLEPPPPPKVRISNLMRVLGVEAVQDPTKVEAHVKQQMAKRLKTHLDANKSRKLTPEQRKAKKVRKMQENVNLGVQVSVYRIDCLGNQSKRFKVDTVAHQLHMTGVLIMYRECNIVVVEGGPKQQSKYRRLMMTRIKWGEDMVKDKEGVANKCVLVWDGMIKDRSFPDFKFRPMKTEEAVRDFFKKHGVQHYWDAALSGTVLEAVIDQ